MDTETFLQDTRDRLTEILRPFQQEVNRQQRMADFIRQCIRCTGRNDFLRLDELLNSKIAGDAEQEAGLSACKELLGSLREYANEQVERYRLQFIEDLARFAGEANLAMEISFPRFSVLKGIEGEVNFSKRTTVINKKVLKSIDPRRIVTAALRVTKQLYDRPYDAQTFIDSIYNIYADIIGKEQLSSDAPVPIRKFYPEYVLSLQSKAFFANMDKARFRGYSVEQFSVDLWRYFEAGIGGTSDGYVLQLKPGRSNSLWLIDGDGERRQITSISFQERED